MLWIGTRKGLFSLRPDARRRAWKLAGPQFLGHIVHHVVQDPRDPRRLAMAAKTGHLGPTVYISQDRGRHWQEAAAPPAFRKARDGEQPRAVERVFWLTPGHASETGTWYAGSAPAGLFRSEDHGAHWAAVSGFNDHAMNSKWAAGLRTPDGELLHSILRRPARRAASVFGDFGRRRIRIDRRRCRLGAVERGRGGRFPSRPERGIRSRSALPDPTSAAAGPALPTESLRQLSTRSPGAALDAHRQRNAEEDRRYRLSDRRAPA